MMVATGDHAHLAGAIWTIGPNERPLPISPLVPATFSRVQAGSVPELAEAMGGGNWEEIRERFERGRRCYAARSAGQLAAYGWVSFGEEFVGELNLHLRLLPDEAYIWDCVTLPAFRQKYLYSALLAYIVTELQKQDYSRMWIGADLDNVPSQKGIARAGFTCVADLVVGRAGTLRPIWAEARPNVPEDLVVQACRVFLTAIDDHLQE